MRTSIRDLSTKPDEHVDSTAENYEQDRQKLFVR